MMTDLTAPLRAPDTRSFNGGYLLYRKVGGNLKRPGFKSQVREPRFRHPTFAAAETEAERLLGYHPESTFIILHEVARVKLKPSDPDALTGCSDDQTFTISSAEPRQPVEGDPAHVFEAHALWCVEMEQRA